MTLHVTGHYPSAAALRSIALGAVDRLRDMQLRRNTDIADRHNAYVDHCLALLFRSTGHRPVHDPFESIRQFDLDLGLFLVADKVLTDTRAWRLVALPPVARDQIRHYLSYLSVLSRRVVEAREDPPAWVSHIPDLLAGKKTSLPLFFFLSSDNLSWQSATPATLEQRWNPYWPFPVGMLRHVLATEIAVRSGRADLSQIQLGHVEIVHPFGVTATQCAANQLQIVSALIAAALEEEGWRPLPPPLRYRGHLREPLPATAQADEGSRPLGQEQRATRRNERMAGIAALVRRALIEVTEGLNSWAKLSQETFAAFTERIVQDARKSGYSPNQALRMLHRFMRAQPGGSDLLRRVASERVIEPEASPYAADTLERYRLIRQLRKHFVSYIDTQGPITAGTMRPETRLAEIVVSASLYSGIADQRRLRGIPAALSSGLHRHSESLYLDIPLLADHPGGPVWRWFPDPISRLLIIGAAADWGGTPPECNTASVLRALARLPLVGLNGNPLTLSSLAQLASSAGSIELPGYVAAVLRGEVTAVSVPAAAWHRVVSDAPLRSEGSKEMPVSETPAGPVTDVSRAAPGMSRGERTRFRRWLAETLSEVASLRVTGNARPNRVHKRALAKAVGQEFTTPGNAWSQVPTLIASWAIHLCQFGSTRKKNLKFSTIRKYVTLVTDALMRLDFGAGGFLDLTDVAFEEAYSRVLFAHSSRKRAVVFGRLQAWHDYLVTQYQIDEPNWSVLAMQAGVLTQKRFADANLITQNEYLYVLACLWSTNQLEERFRIQCAALVLLGFRFGLRFGEAWRLQFRDIQYDPDVGQMYVWVRSSAQGEVKTLAGSRVVPLLEVLAPIERQVLHAILGYGEEGFLQARTYHIMASSPADPIPTRRHTAVTAIHRVMREITGDPDIRYHHFRHGWATRMIVHQQLHTVTSAHLDSARHYLPTDANAANMAEFHGPSTVGQSPLRSVATALGHADEPTTLSSYCHGIDLIAAALAECRTPELPDRAVAYALGLSAATIRSRRRRQLDCYALRSNREANAILVPPPVSTGEARDCPELQATVNDPGTRCTLLDLDLLLTRIAVSVCPLDELAARQGIPEGWAKRVVEHATMIERLSGYDRYRLVVAQADPVITESAHLIRHPERPLPRSETLRVRAYLPRLDDSLSRMSDAERADLRVGAEVWTRTHLPAQWIHLVSSITDLQALVRYFRVHPGVEGYVGIPPEYSASETMRAALASVGWDVVHLQGPVPLAASKSRRDRYGRLTLTVRSIGAELRTASALARVNFLLASWIGVDPVH